MNSSLNNLLPSLCRVLEQRTRATAVFSGRVSGKLKPQTLVPTQYAVNEKHVLI